MPNSANSRIYKIAKLHKASTRKQLELPFPELDFSELEKTFEDLEGPTLIKNIPFEAITMRKGQGDAILRHLRESRPSMTDGYPELFYDARYQQLIVEDGNHRIFQAYIDGDRTFDGLVSAGGYSNYAPVYDYEDRFEWGMFPNEEIMEDGRVSKIAELRKVAHSTVLNDLSEIRTNFEDADFWVVRKGSKDKVGSVVKEFSPQYIGIKVTEEARGALDPKYVYYALMNIHNQGVWKGLSYGSTNLVHIRIEDIKSIPIG